MGAKQGKNHKNNMKFVVDEAWNDNWEKQQYQTVVNNSSFGTNPYGSNVNPYGLGGPSLPQPAAWPTTSAPQFPVVYNTTTFGASTITAQPLCVTGGHLIEEYDESALGDIWALCSRCGDRVRVRRVPSGEALVRVLMLVEMLRTADKPEDVDVALPLIIGLRDQIEAEHARLKEIEDLYHVLYQRLLEIGFVQ